MDIKRIVGLSAAGVVAAFAIACAASPWWRSRMLADFWPFDASRVAPNILAALVQAIFVAAILAVLYPPFRYFLDRELDHFHAKLDHSISLAEHIIKHSPKIPEHPDERPKVGRP